MTDETKDVVYQILRLLRENAIKILMAVRENKKIRWKELQEITKMPTATFNRALAALQEIHFIKKEDNLYQLTWTGKLVSDALLVVGWRLAEAGERVKDFVAEELLAKDISMAIVILLFISVKRRGKLNIEAFEKSMENEMKVAKDIFKEYEKDGYIEIKDGWIISKEKMNKLDISKIFK